MTTQELRKEYNEQWKKENPTKYTVWLICYIGDIIPIAVMLLQLLGRGGLDDKKISTMIICMVVLFVMMIIAMVISLDQKKGWRAYLEENQKRLK